MRDSKTPYAALTDFDRRVLMEYGSPERLATLDELTLHVLLAEAHRIFASYSQAWLKREPQRESV